MQVTGTGLLEMMMTLVIILSSWYCTRVVSMAMVSSVITQSATRSELVFVSLWNKYD